MQDDKYSLQFLIAVTLASILQAWGRPVEEETKIGRFARRVFGGASGMFVGIYGTPFVLAWRQLDPDVWELPVGIILAFTGAAIVEFLIELNWKRVVDLVKLWRGGK